MIRCADCPLREFGLFDPFSAEEEDAMQRFKRGEMAVDPGTTVLREGSKAAQLYTVLSGMGVRYKTLPDGRRQVINFIFPGDFVGLQASVMGEMQHSAEATTDMRLCVFDRTTLWRFMKSSPERAFDLTWLSAVEEHLVSEALATVGQMRAESRIAWALLRLHQRANAVGLADPCGATPLPFRQQDLADALGLSLVHTNKTLKTLRVRKLALWTDGLLKIPSRKALADEAGLYDTPEKLHRRPLI